MSGRIVRACAIKACGRTMPICAYVEHYNNHRYHESLTNLTPADVYHGRGAKILKMREEIKKQTIRKRRLQHQAAAA